MGVDLKLLLPWDFATRAWLTDSGEGFWGVDSRAYVGFRLDVPRTDDAFEALREVRSKPLPGVLLEALLGSYDEDVDDREYILTEDPYGNEPRMRRAADVAEAIRPFGGPQARILSAIVAFLEAMPPDYPVVLWWC